MASNIPIFMKLAFTQMHYIKVSVNQTSSASVNRYGKYAQIVIYALKAATAPICTKLRPACRYLCKNSCIEFHYNSASDLVNDAMSRTERRTDGQASSPLRRYSSLCKECPVMKVHPLLQYSQQKVLLSCVEDCANRRNFSLSLESLMTCRETHSQHKLFQMNALTFLLAYRALSLPTSPDVMISFLKLRLAQLEEVRTKSTFTFSLMNLKQTISSSNKTAVPSGH